MSNLVGNLTIVESNPNSGFHWPYLLYVPDSQAIRSEEISILINPNNTGKASDDMLLHKEKAVRDTRYLSSTFEKNNYPFVLLKPIFPRFKKKMGGWKIYTHALDRDSMEHRPHKLNAITIKASGDNYSKGSYFIFNLDKIFAVQNNLIYQAVASDFDPMKKIPHDKPLVLTFVFEKGFDIDQKFNLIELPRRGGFYFKDVYLDDQKSINNQECLNGSKLNIVKLVQSDDSNFTQLWNKDGNHTTIDQKKTIRRLDLQLIAMIEDAKSKLTGNLGMRVKEKVVLYGFSASGMFTDRFTYLHPNLVSAATIGAPGGLPMSPLVEYKGQPLRYPIGISDIEGLAEKPFDRETFENVHRYIFVGEKDMNDSVPYPDGYEKEDEELVFSIFDDTPAKRHRIIEKLFEEQGLTNNEFRIYPGIEHQFTEEMRNDAFQFLLKWR